MSPKVLHRITVKKRRLFGSKMWWATCTCGKFYQGCHHKQDAERMADDHMRVLSFTCPRCGMTSYNANDIREGFCGNCHDWTGNDNQTLSP